jgi:uncharacterized membrane protein YukC
MEQKDTVGYEKKDVNAKMIIGVGLSSVLILIIIFVVLSDYFTVMETEAVYQAQLKPESVTLNELRAEDEKILTTYKLIDAEKGVYRIPIERAMHLLAEEASD